MGEKIKNQMLVLRAVQSPRADQLCRYLDELEFGDRTNREGHAAKVYFNALFGSHFSRSDDCPTNAALNYGYSLILSCFNREVVAAGYLTQLGLFHDNMFNTYNLSCDLMEPFRPLVDACVHNLAPKQFEKAEKVAVLSILNQEVQLDGRVQTVLNAIRLYAASVFRALAAQDVAEIHFPVAAYEL